MRRVRPAGRFCIPGRCPVPRVRGFGLGHVGGGVRPPVGPSYGGTRSPRGRPSRVWSASGGGDPAMVNYKQRSAPWSVVTATAPKGATDPRKSRSPLVGRPCAPAACWTTTSSPCGHSAPSCECPHGAELMLEPSAGTQGLPTFTVVDARRRPSTSCRDWQQSSVGRDGGSRGQESGRYDS